MQVTVGSRARDGRKQIAGPHFAGIGRDRFNNDVVGAEETCGRAKLPQADAPRLGSPSWHPTGPPCPESPSEIGRRETVPSSAIEFWVLGRRANSFRANASQLGRGLWRFHQPCQGRLAGARYAFVAAFARMRRYAGQFPHFCECGYKCGPRASAYRHRPVGSPRALRPTRSFRHSRPARSSAM